MAWRGPIFDSGFNIFSKSFFPFFRSISPALGATHRRCASPPCLSPFCTLFCSGIGGLKPIPEKFENQIWIQRNLKSGSGLDIWIRNPGVLRFLFWGKGASNHFASKNGQTKKPEQPVQAAKMRVYLTGSRKDGGKGLYLDIKARQAMQSGFLNYMMNLFPFLKVY